MQTALAEQEAPLSYGDALSLIGGLSAPSKMPGFGWSTPAERCIVGSKLREVENSVCSECYACKGFYPMLNVQKALEKRYQALSDPRFVEAFVKVLTDKYSRIKMTRTLPDGTAIKENRFRWHDSGDLQSVEHLQMICDICEATPQLVHYLPTRENAMVHPFVKEGGEIPDNLHIKISQPMIGQKPPRQPMGMDYSTVGVDEDEDEIFQCPARKHQGNKCLDCDACWRPGNINYPLH